MCAIREVERDCLITIRRLGREYFEAGNLEILSVCVCVCVCV